MNQEEYNEIECSYCGYTPDYKENIYECLDCKEWFCSDHHADFDLCVNCADPKDFKESMENR